MPHLEMQNQALSFAGLPKHVDARILDLRHDGQGFNGRVAMGFQAPSQGPRDQLGLEPRLVRGQGPPGWLLLAAAVAAGQAGHLSRQA